MLVELAERDRCHFPRRLLEPDAVCTPRVPRTQRSAPFFTAWCAAEPGSSLLILTGVPALRSGMKNAAARPGHEGRLLRGLAHDRRAFGEHFCDVLALAGDRL